MTDGPYKLPAGWKWVRLREVCEKPQYGYTQSATAEPIGPRFVRVTDLQQNGVNWDVVPFCRCDERTLKKYLLQPGDLLVARSGSVGKATCIRDTPGPAVFASYLLRVKPRADFLLPDYAAWYFKTSAYWQQIRPRGAAQQNINAQVLSDLLLPLPQLDEQRKIVARIEELMGRIREARRLRAEAKRDADRLLQAALAEVFPAPAPPPPGWKWVRLREVAERCAALVEPSKHPDKVYNYLSMDRVAPGQWSEPDPNPTPGTDIASTCIAFQPGFVLYGKLRPYLNKVVLCSRDGVASTEFVPLKPDPHRVASSWLAFWLRTPWFVAYSTRNTTGSRQPRVRQEAFWQAPLPLPPLDEQRSFVAQLERLAKQVVALTCAMEMTETEVGRLEQAILDRAFRGEL